MKSHATFRHAFMAGIWLLSCLMHGLSHAQAKPRARDLGIPFDGVPGTWNAITDVAGVEVGHVTLISGEGELKVGQGPVRTGVTAILPRGIGRSTHGQHLRQWLGGHFHRVFHRKSGSRAGARSHDAGHAPE